MLGNIPRLPYICSWCGAYLSTGTDFALSIGVKSCDKVLYEQVKQEKGNIKETILLHLSEHYGG